MGWSGKARIGQSVRSPSAIRSIDATADAAVPHPAKRMCRDATFDVGATSALREQIGDDLIALLLGEPNVGRHAHAAALRRG